MAEQRCKTCKWLRVTPDKAGRRVVRSGGSYLCTFQPQWPPMPDSMPTYAKLPTAGYVSADQGTECPVWEALS